MQANVDISEPETMLNAEHATAIAPRRILLATDLQDLERTLPVLRNEARRYDAQVLIVHVVPLQSAPPVSPALLVYAHPEEHNRFAHDKLEAVSDALNVLGIHCCFRVIPNGNVAEAIETLSRQWKADRVIVGCHGAAKFYLRILGSDAETIFRRVAVPVLAVGPRVRVHEAAAGTLRILVGLSLNGDNDYLLRFAHRYAGMSQVSTTLLHVIEKQGSSSELQTRKEDCERLLREQFVNRRASGEVACHVEPGNATEIILRTAKEGNYDLIVLGNMSASHFTPETISCSAYEVLCQAACPVLVVADHQDHSN